MGIIPPWMLRSGLMREVRPEEQSGLPSRFTIWGIVNTTPDSFFDGGKWTDPAAALRHALDLSRAGARILDLGGASSRPGSEDVPPDEEERRVIPLLRSLAALREAGKELPSSRLFSVDTWRARVAAAAMENGADILNDISACSWDPELADVAAQYRPGYVLMHCLPGGRPNTMQKSPSYADILGETVAFFEEKMRMLTSAGLPEENIILDPGIGFGKTAEHNAALLRGMESIASLGRPILLGVSNKSLFGDLLGLPAGSRGTATAVCTALLAARGVTHHRVHDAETARQSIILADSFTNAGI